MIVQKNVDDLQYDLNIFNKMRQQYNVNISAEKMKIMELRRKAPVR